MTTAACQLLGTFEALPIGDQLQATLEILRREGETGDVSEDCLVMAADELFRTMDADEVRHATS